MMPSTSIVRAIAANAGVQSEHGSAAVAPTTAAPGHGDIQSPALGANAATDVNIPGSPGSAPVPSTGRSPGMFTRRLRPDTASPPGWAHASPPTPPPVTSPQAPDRLRRKRRSRSPHASPASVHAADGASEGRVSAAVYFLEESM